MQGRTFYDALRLMFSPEALIPFVLGSLALAVMGNAIFALLAGWLGTSPGAIGEIIAGTALVLLVTAWVLALVVRRLRPPPRPLNKQRPTPRRGLILLVSNREPCEKALALHKPALQYAWLLHSARTARLAQELCDQLEDPARTVKLVEVQDVFAPIDTQRAVTGIYAALPAGLSAADVILDFTGMTALASVGAVLGAIGPQAPLQYTPAVYDDHNRPIGALDPVEVSFLPPPAPPPPPPSHS